MLEDKDLLSIQEVRTKVEKAYAAWQKYRTYSQEQVDAIVERMAAAARANAKRLADLAVEETGYGNAKDKYIKNLLNCDWLPRRMRGIKTVGILRELPDEKIVEIGVPVGVVAAILPTTNPTSTAISKTLVSLKAGNAIVISPHPRAFKCTCATAAILYQAALEAGAPEDIIQCVDRATMEGINALMRHERVERDPRHRRTRHGEGGVLERQAGVRRGTGQRAGAGGHVRRPGRRRRQDRRRKVLRLRHRLLQRAGAGGRVHAARPHPGAAQAAQGVPLQRPADGRARQAAAHAQLDRQPAVRGPVAHQDRARWRASKCPPDTSIICCEIAGVGKKFPLSAEKLSPVLSLIFVADFATALDTCFGLLQVRRRGTHRASIYAKNDTRIREYGMRMPAMRVLVNTPAPQGSTGITTNVFPSMTLGCGAMAGNSTSDNVGPLHLINIKRLAYTVRTPEAGVRNAAGLRQGAGWPHARGRRRRAGRSRGRGLRGGTLPRLARHRRVGARDCAAAAPPADVPRRLRSPRSSSPWWPASPPKWSTAFWPAAATHRPVRRAARRNPAAIADWQTPGAKTPPPRSRSASQTGGVRLRGGCAPGDQREPQDLHRAEDDRYALGPRPGQPL